MDPWHNVVCRLDRFTLHQYDARRSMFLITPLRQSQTKQFTLSPHLKILTPVISALHPQDLKCAGNSDIKLALTDAGK